MVWRFTSDPRITTMIFKNADVRLRFLLQLLQYCFVEVKKGIEF